MKMSAIFLDMESGAVTKFLAGTACGRCVSEARRGATAAPLLAVYALGEGESQLALYHPKGEFGWRGTGKLLEFVSLALIHDSTIGFEPAEQRGHRLPIQMDAAAFCDLDGD